MTSKQKAKGSGYEREVARFLTELYGETFTRVPNSGAFIGGKNSARKEFLHEGQIRSFKGDIIPGQSFPKLNTECKFYKDFSFNLLFTYSTQLEAWLDQLMDVADVGDLNILFMKFNRQGRWVAVQTHLSWCTDCNHLYYNSASHGSWLFFEFDAFFKKNYQILQQHAK